MEGCCDHPFLTVLVVGVLGVRSDANGWEEIEDFASDRHEWLPRDVDFPHGVPFDDIYARLSRAFRPDTLAGCLAHTIDEASARAERDSSIAFVSGDTALPGVRDRPGEVVGECRRGVREVVPRLA